MQNAESIKQLAADIGTLVREELRVAKSEMAEKVKSAGIAAGMFSGSAVAAMMALASLTAFVVIVLALAVPLWASALIVTVVWAAIATALAILGRKKVEDATPFLPEQTINNFKEDVEFAKQRAKDVRG